MGHSLGQKGTRPLLAFHVHFPYPQGNINTFFFQLDGREPLNTRTLTAIRSRYPLALFLFLYFLFAILTYQDYGSTFDESGVYTRGVLLFHSLTHADWTRLDHKTVPDDGLVVYDHLYSCLLYCLNSSCDLDQYHLLNLLFGALVFIAMFEVLLWRYPKPWLCLLGPIFLFFIPRFMGDLPANPKDMPFAVFYFLALAAILYYHGHPKTSWFRQGLVLGLFFGLAVCSRLLGLSLFLIYPLFVLHFYWHGVKHRGLKTFKPFAQRNGMIWCTALAVTTLLVLATWPYLRVDTISRLTDLLILSRHFAWVNPVLFMGREILSTQLPWTYLFVWVLITTPLFILSFLALSLTRLRKTFQNPLWVLLASTLSIHFFLYLTLRPVLYDGLRHYLFLLPILSAWAAMTAIEFFTDKKPLLPKRVAGVLVALNLLWVIGQMVLLHPYEYIYFNETVGGVKGTEGRFDNDYWGASYKEAMVWLKGNAPTEGTVKVTCSGNPYQLLDCLAPNMKWTDELNDADYYLSTTRDNKDKLAGSAPVVHVVQREGIPLCYVFKLK